MDGVITRFVAKVRGLAAPEFVGVRVAVKEVDDAETIVDASDIPAFEVAPPAKRSRKGPRLVSSNFRGITVAIEYLDAEGDLTYRRISLGDLVEWPNGSQTIYAHCYERQAPRCFRVDRIQCFFDQDGVVTSASEFFRWADDQAAERLADMIEDGDLFLVLKQIAYEELVLLVALARCDGVVHPEELEVLIQHFVYAIEDTGVICDERSISQIKAAIARFSAPPWEVERAITRVSRLPDARIRKFQRSARSLAEADGMIATEEHELISELCSRGAL